MLEVRTGAPTISLHFAIGISHFQNENVMVNDFKYRKNRFAQIL